MAHPFPSRDGGRARAAVAQVLIARTRERLCEACATARPLAAPVAVSLRVEGTDFFVITPDAVDLSAIGPAQTSLMHLDGTLAGGAWDRRTRASSAAAAHAHAHRSAPVGAVASRGDRVRHAPTPAAALSAVAEPEGTEPDDGVRPDPAEPPRRRSTQ